MVLAPGKMSIFDHDGAFVSQSQFVPMSPGEEQLIFYGADTVNTVSRKLEREEDELVDVELRPEGSVRLVKNRTRTYSYMISNHSDQTVPDFYIDHKPDNHNYAILTRENCVHKTQGWARYSVSLPPREDVTIKVQEEMATETHKCGK